MAPQWTESALLCAVGWLTRSCMQRILAYSSLFKAYRLQDRPYRLSTLIRIDQIVELALLLLPALMKVYT